MEYPLINASWVWKLPMFRIILGNPIPKYPLKESLEYTFFLPLRLVAKQMPSCFFMQISLEYPMREISHKTSHNYQEHIPEFSGTYFMRSPIKSFSKWGKKGTRFFLQLLLSQELRVAPFRWKRRRVGRGALSNTLWLCQNSYWKWPSRNSEFSHKKRWIFP